MNQTKDEEEVHITENDLPQEFILKVLGQHEAKGMWGIKHTREPVDSMVKYAKLHELSLPLVQVVITKEGIFVNPIANRYDCQVYEGDSTRKTLTKQNSERCRVHPDRERQNFRTEKIGSNEFSTIPRFRKPQEEVQHRPAKNCVETSVKSAGNFNFFGRKQEKKIPEKPATDLRILDKFSRFDWRKAGILFFGIDTISYGVQDLIFTRVFSMIVVLDRRTRQATRSGSSFMCHAFVCESRNTARRVTYALAAAFQAYGRAVKKLKDIEMPKKNIPDAKPKKFTIELRPPTEIDFDVSEA